jgi:ubiquinol-cytochrome c reductase iron-sulfur subunit
VGGFVTAYPEGARREDLGSPLIVVRIDPDELHPPGDRKDWAVDGDGRPLTVSDIEIGGFRTGFPEGASSDELGSPLILVRLEPGEIELPPDQQAGMPQGVIAFSKICPHAGCAVSMYRHPLYEPTAVKPALVCPCHYSTFDVRRGGELIFGPAGRALPRLPLQVNGDDELVAAGDYLDTYGPSWSGVRQHRRGT